MARLLAIGKVGSRFDGTTREGVVYRLNGTPQSPVKYPYLVVSEDIENGRADMLMINNFRRAKDHLKKKARNGVGLEVMLAPARKMDSVAVAKWIEDLRDLHTFCHMSRCQFVLSSGANSMHEMVSGPCLDAILRTCGIDPQIHWREMNKWLEGRVARRVSI
jgi:RNase P/RNase MRP subunit p30